MNAQPNRKAFADATKKPAEQKPVSQQQQQQYPMRTAQDEAIRRWQQGPGQQNQM
jgi:hypothetical protein